MSGLSKARNVITGRQRKADRAQAARVARSQHDLDQARNAHPIGLTPEVARADSVRARALHNATPRARAWSSAIYQHGTLRPPAERIRAARQILARQPEIGAEALRADLARRPAAERTPRRTRRSR